MNSLEKWLAENRRVVKEKSNKAYVIYKGVIESMKRVRNKK